MKTKEKYFTENQRVAKAANKYGTEFRLGRVIAYRPGYTCEYQFYVKFDDGRSSWCNSTNLEEVTK